MILLYHVIRLKLNSKKIVGAAAIREIFFFESFAELFKNLFAAREFVGYVVSDVELVTIFEKIHQQDIANCSVDSMQVFIQTLQFFCHFTKRCGFDGRNAPDDRKVPEEEPLTPKRETGCLGEETYGISFNSDSAMFYTDEKVAENLDAIMSFATKGSSAGETININASNVTISGDDYTKDFSGGHDCSSHG